MNFADCGMICNFEFARNAKIFNKKFTNAFLRWQYVLSPLLTFAIIFIVNRFIGVFLFVHLSQSITAIAVTCEFFGINNSVDCVTVLFKKADFCPFKTSDRTKSLIFNQ